MSMSAQPHSDQGGPATGVGIPDWNPVREGKAPPSVKGRFNIEISSVYYFAEEQHICAAVVLRTSFILHEGRKLKYAECPLAVYAQDSNNERLNIKHYFPEREEYVQVDYHVEQKRWIVNPAINFGSGSAQLGSMEKNRTGNKVISISLQTVNKQEKIPEISWYYKSDSKESMYPGAIDIFLVVRKLNCATPWFKFKLQLTGALKVDVHGRLPFGTDFRDRWVGVPVDGDGGWSFSIGGRYNEDHAKNVIESLQTTTPSVGLKAAACSMLAALNPPLNPTLTSISASPEA